MRKFLGQEHKKFIKDEYKKDIPTFNEICKDGKYEIVNFNSEDTIDFEALLKQMVDYFYEVMPTFVEKLMA